MTDTLAAIARRPIADILGVTARLLNAVPHIRAAVVCLSTTQRLRIARQRRRTVPLRRHSEVRRRCIRVAVRIAAPEAEVGGLQVAGARGGDGKSLNPKHRKDAKKTSELSW